MVSVRVNPWRFVPTLTGYLVVASFLYRFLNRSVTSSCRGLIGAALVLLACGTISTIGVWLFESSGHDTLTNALKVARKVFPISIIDNTFLCISVWAISCDGLAG